MNSIIKCVMLSVISLIAFNSCDAQVKKNIKVATVKVYGNCGMCKKTIEKAALVKGVSTAEWSPETSMAKITIDSSKTSIDDVLKKIAAAGYDSDKFRAKDDVYSNLHGCCQYDRPDKK